MSYELREFRETDREQVYALYATVFGEKSLARFKRRWQWQFGKDALDGGRDSRIYVAEQDERIVGHLATFPRQMKVFDRRYNHPHTCDIMVSPSARRQGIGQALSDRRGEVAAPIRAARGYSDARGRMAIREGRHLLNTFPACLRPSPTKSGVSFALYHLIPAVSKHRIWHLTVRIGMSIAASTNLLLHPWPAKRYQVERVTAFGTEFDTLWERLSPSFPIAYVRDRQFVQWRFGDDPVFNHVVLGARDAAGTLVGYLALRISPKWNMKVGVIMDLFCPPDSPEIVRALLYEALRVSSQEQCDMVVTYGLLPSIRKVVCRYLYVRGSCLDRWLNRPVLTAWEGEPELESQVLDENNWHLTYADGDIGFEP